MVIEIRGQQYFPFLLAIPYCFVLHIMFSSCAFTMQDTDHRSAGEFLASTFKFFAFKSQILKFFYDTLNYFIRPQIVILNAGT